MDGAFLRLSHLVSELRPFSERPNDGFQEGFRRISRIRNRKKNEYRSPVGRFGGEDFATFGEGRRYEFVSEFQKRLSPVPRDVRSGLSFLPGMPVQKRNGFRYEFRRTFRIRVRNQLGPVIRRHEVRTPSDSKYRLSRRKALLYERKVFGVHRFRIVVCLGLSSEELRVYRLPSEKNERVNGGDVLGSRAFREFDYIETLRPEREFASRFPVIIGTASAQYSDFRHSARKFHSREEYRRYGEMAYRQRMNEMEKSSTGKKELAVSALEKASSIFEEAWLRAESDYARRCAELLSEISEKAVPMAYAAFSGSVVSVASRIRPPASSCDDAVATTLEKVGTALGIGIR